MLQRRLPVADYQDVRPRAAQPSDEESPTSVPTKSPRTADFWYADYDTTWEEAGCKNTLPLPYQNVNDRPNYPTQLESCNKAYADQPSGACLRELPNPPTKSPMGITITQSPMAPFAVGTTDRPTKSPVGTSFPTVTNSDFRNTGSKAAKASGRRTNKDDITGSPSRL